MIRTKAGVSELTIPVTALSSSVCANAKRNAGTKLPINPDMKMSDKYLLLILRSHARAKGIIKSEADKIRIDATWVAV
jgi:hypothetical protein